MLTYRETKHAKEEAFREGAGDLKDRMLAQVRSRRLDASDVSQRSPVVSQRSPVDRSYLTGFNDALAALETWLEGLAP